MYQLNYPISTHHLHLILVLNSLTEQLPVVYCQPALLSAGVPSLIQLPAFLSAALRLFEIIQLDLSSWLKPTSK